MVVEDLNLNYDFRKNMATRVGDLSYCGGDGGAGGIVVCSQRSNSGGTETSAAAAADNEGAALSATHEVCQHHVAEKD